MCIKFIRTVTILIISITFLVMVEFAFAQTNSKSSVNDLSISVYDFIEKISGSRNYFISTILTFDVQDGQQRKKIEITFDLKVKNLEIFTFYIKSPKVFEDIVINYDIISKKVTYSYKKFSSTEELRDASLSSQQVGDLLTSITDFLSSPLFETMQKEGHIEFKPKNAAVLARFGVQPITVKLYIERSLPKKIEIVNDKSDEKITMEFPKFDVSN
ncbi:MAG: hypothetical protein WHS64_01920 [Fervidobacterium sp.]|uniref:Uncharacterized protein n=1 Tax=Fervidobacterium gondwanense DSM 13020 TaxID=1121883 RepID=A0A1M7RVR8_FERGO|nr:hypothetical protein [Fervidobacterium gondwanense]UXF00034.1 hypothetical protein IB67_00090 [Fervidobacterium riparium]SHN50457.1 hypothetical protein SAMN02745226_00245 [Fervidobacterium gondwanense DSM 13020]